MTGRDEGTGPFGHGDDTGPFGHVEPWQRRAHRGDDMTEWGEGIGRRRRPGHGDDERSEETT